MSQSYHRETEAIRMGKIVAKALDGSITAAEQAELDRWLADDANRALYQEMTDKAPIEEQISSFRTYDEQQGYRRFLASVAQQKGGKRRMLWRIAAAAAVIACISISIYFASKGPAPDTSQHVTQATDDIVPGGNKATLTLADGSTVVLDESKDGIIISDELTYTDGTAILDGQSAADAPSKMLALATPKGGQYQVTLSDGTKVFLNAQSRLTYPARFTHTDRRVTLIGEGYFEVSADPQHPFIVSVSGQEVKVLGTVFNIQAYPEDKAVATTLVEGKVQLIATQGTAASVVLHPGEQGLTRASGIHVSRVDAAEATAWKEGKFIFNDTDIPAVMRQIARWYDAEVVYTDALTDITFSGSISRYDDIRDVLRKIELTNKINLKIEGRRIMVSRR